jgi:hypothetical protein
MIFDGNRSAFKDHDRTTRWRQKKQRRKAEERSLGNHGSSGLRPHLLRPPSHLGSTLLVLVVAAPPDAARFLVAPFGSPVEPLVHAPERV